MILKLIDNGCPRGFMVYQDLNLYLSEVSRFVSEPAFHFFEVIHTPLQRRDRRGIVIDCNQKSIEIGSVLRACHGTFFIKIKKICTHWYLKSK